MKKKILLTGGSGFVGSNIIPLLKKDYQVDSPSRAELDARNPEQVADFVKNGHYNAVVHLASPSPVRSSSLDSYSRLFEDCLKIFLNFYSVREHCDKIIYSGSGAEFDKRRDITNVSEEEIGAYIPVDDYGRAKFIMNELARHSTNIYNLRIFGCYGPGEYDSKFITHAIRCCLRNEPVTIRQDCYFDYMYVDDFADYVKFCIDNDPLHHDYNACSGEKIALSQIAQIVNAKLNNTYKTEIMQDGFNKEYTASNKRFLCETDKAVQFTSIESGIEKLIAWEKEHYEKKSC